MSKGNPYSRCCEEVVGDVADHVISVVAHNLPPDDLAGDLAQHVGWRDDGLDVLLVIVIVIVVLVVLVVLIVIGGCDMDQLRSQSQSLLPRYRARRTAFHYQDEKVSQLLEPMAKAGLRRSSISSRARRRRISAYRSAPSCGTGGTGTRQLFKCRHAGKLTSGHGTGWPPAYGRRAYFTRM
jgi:hypothetical protein